VNCRKIRKMRHGRISKKRTRFLKSEGITPTHRRAMTAMVPRRSQRAFLNQTNMGTGPEKKNQDLVGNFQSPTGSQWTACQLLNGIAQGTGDGNRVGRKIIITSVQFRAICKENSSSPSPSQNR